MGDKKIIIVDDDESIRKTFSLLLSGHYNIFLAKDAREALTWLECLPVDMIIADLRLPGKNGLQMLLDFRQGGYQGKIILISAFPDQIETEDLESLGVDRLFVKPLDLRALIEAIDLLLKQPES
ncbi:MAG: response regulator [Acidobacteriota bacterium]|nr:response regulator [Acidobacteriota bacterium]MDW3229056.1 response regulator [Acidobacteriota bacterium]